MSLVEPPTQLDSDQKNSDQRLKDRLKIYEFLAYMYNIQLPEEIESLDEFRLAKVLEVSAKYSFTHVMAVKDKDFRQLCFLKSKKLKDQGVKLFKQQLKEGVQLVEFILKENRFYPHQMFMEETIFDILMKFHDIINETKCSKLLMF